MTKHRVAAVVVAEGVWSIGTQWLWFSHGFEPWGLVLDLAVGWAAVGAGLLAWSRRPTNNAGPLFVAVGFAWSIGNLQIVDDPFVRGLSEWLVGLHAVLLVHLAATFPACRIASRGQRALVVAGYGTLALSLLQAVTFNPFRISPPCTGCVANGWLLFDSASFYDALVVLGYATQAVLSVIAVVVLTGRWRRATAPVRRVVAPAIVAGLALGIAYVLNSVIAPVFVELNVPLDVATSVVQLVVPVAFVFGLLRLRLDQFGVSGLVLELGRQPSPERLQEVLGRTLHDPSLEVLYWSTATADWVDAQGASAGLPSEGDGRSYTVLQRSGEPIAALLHDEALLDEGNLVAAVSAAALLTLENERLRAQVRAQLEEVKASRMRIVEAGQAERRRVERNLHDGAQQRLLSLLLALGLARDRLATGADRGDEAAELLGRATAELGLAVEELRELAQGIHPALLTDQGLGAAIESLCVRASLPVVATVACGRYPAVIEGMAYFAVSEALANVAKHAGARSAWVDIRVGGPTLQVEVVDDGSGGADPARGSGLRSLADRSAALGGTLDVDSPAGGGTIVRMTLPCA